MKTTTKERFQVNTLRRIPGFMTRAVAAVAVLVAAALPIGIAAEAGAAAVNGSATYLSVGTEVATVAGLSTTLATSGLQGLTTNALNDLIVATNLDAKSVVTTASPTAPVVSATPILDGSYVAHVYAPSATIGAGTNSGEIVLSGTGFAAGDTISSNAPGVTFSAPTVNAGFTAAQASFTSTSALVAGYYNVTDTSSTGVVSTYNNALQVVAVPTISSVSPATAANSLTNTALQVTINGSGFEGSNTVAPSVVLTSTVDGTQLGASSVSWTNAAQIVATFNLNGAPTSGGYVVTVINGDGGTGNSVANAFTLTGPSITSLSPTSLAVPTTSAATSQVTIIGSGFVTGAYAKVNNVVVPSTVVSPTEMQIQVTVNTGTGATVWPVVITNPDGSSTTSNAAGGGGLGIGEPSAAAPTVTSVSAPSSLSEGGMATFTVFGTGFGPANASSTANLGFYPTYGTAVDSHLTCNTGSVNVISDTELTCLVTAGSGVVTGEHSLIVTTGGGGSSVPFAKALNVAGASITSVTPANVGVGYLGALTISGSGLTGATLGTISNGAIATAGATSVTDTSATVTTTTGPTTSGTMVIDLTVGSTVVQGAVVVGGSTITVTSITLPNSTTAVGVGATAVPFTINGAGFLTGATLTDTTGTAGLVTFTVASVTPTAITGTVSVATGATTGANAIHIVNTDGGFGNTSLTIDAGPVIASLTPYSVLAGKVTTVIIGGSGFLNTSTVTSGSTLVKVGTVTYVSPAELTVSLTVAPITGTNAINVPLNVVNVDNGTASYALGINAGPTVTGTYTVPNPSTNAEVVVTGTGFEYGMIASSANPAYTVSVGSVTVATSTTPASAVLLVTTAASTEAAITLTNPDGGSTIFNLNAPAVTPPPPVTTGKKVPFTHGTSGSAVVGRTVILTISGGNFYGQPRLTSNEGGTRAVVSKDSGTSLTVRITVRGGSAAGEHTLTITLADGKSCRANYRVIK